MPDNQQPKINVKAHDLWPTRIWSFELHQLASQHSDWMNTIYQKREADPSKPGYSIRGGWHSDRNLFTDPSFKPLAVACRSTFKEVFKLMQPMTNFRFRLDAWANIQERGGFNVSHIHANTLLSGCFYLKVPEGSGEIVFKDPRPGAVMTGFPGRGINTAKDFKIKPTEGTLLIFPNWLEHYVESHEGEFDRISIAMNAVAGGA
jgi:uncharacterized protein (TIGR02466 family)